MPTEAQVKRIATAIAKGAGRDVQAEAMALVEERRLYELLRSRHGPGEGWYIVADEGDKPLPMRRLEYKSPPAAEVVRNAAKETPLLCRIIPYGGIEWWEARNLVDLTDEELDSAFIYRAMYEGAVAKGEAPPRPIEETDPGEEPSGGELYRIAKAVQEGIPRFEIKDRLKYTAGYLLSSIDTGGTASEIVERAFREQTGEQIMAALTGIAQVVPEVGRLVTWLDASKAA